MKEIRSHPSQSVRPTLSALRGGIEREFRQLRQQYPRDVRLALNQAEAIAWQTGLAPLVFPTLATEMLDRLSAWHSRQKEIRKHDPMVAFSE